MLANNAGNDDCVRRAPATAPIAKPPTSPTSSAIASKPPQRRPNVTRKRYQANRHTCLKMKRRHRPRHSQPHRTSNDIPACHALTSLGPPSNTAKVASPAPSVVLPPHDHETTVAHIRTTLQNTVTRCAVPEPRVWMSPIAGTAPFAMTADRQVSHPAHESTDRSATLRRSSRRPRP